MLGRHLQPLADLLRMARLQMRASRPIGRAGHRPGRAVLGLGRLLEQVGEDVILGERRCAADGQPIRLRARCIDEILDGLVGRLGAHRKHQLVDRHDHQDRHRVAVVAGQPSLDLARHDHRRRAGDGVRVALLVDQVVEAHRARAARAVHHVERHRRPFVLVDDAGDHAHQVVGAAARGVGNDHAHGTRRVLLGRGGCGDEQRGTDDGNAFHWLPNQTGWGGQSICSSYFEWDPAIRY